MRIAVIKPGQTDKDQQWIHSISFDEIVLIPNEENAHEFPKGSLKAIEPVIEHHGLKVVEISSGFVESVEG